MKKILVVWLIAVMAWVGFPPASEGQESNTPIAQPIVRQGEFARELVEALRMIPARSETEALDMLAASGISPERGWIADYPMTPDILGEVENSIQGAARSGAIGLDEEGAMRAFQDVKRHAGLEGIRSHEEAYAEREPALGREEHGYPESGADIYFEREGPPIVTYYPPPYAYVGLYGWVPYPFWYSGVFFSGFYILRDFHRPIFVHKRPYVVSNRFFDRHTRKLHFVEPHKRFLRDVASSGGPRTGSGRGSEGLRQRDFKTGQERPEAGRMERRGGEQGSPGSGFKSRENLGNRVQPRSDRGGRGGRDSFSAPRPPSGTRGNVSPRRDGAYSPNRATVRSPSSFGAERRTIGSSDRGGRGNIGSISRQNPGSSKSFSDGRVRSFENRSFQNRGSWGSEGASRGSKGGKSGRR